MKPQIPDPSEPRDPNAKSWTWKSGIGKEIVHHILHLENRVLYCRMGIRSTDERNQLLGAVKQTHPLISLHPSDMLHVDMIHEMRFSKSINTLEIDHGDRYPFTIRGSDICEDVYCSIRKSISRQIRVERGTISIWNAIQSPAAGIILLVPFGGMLSYLLWQ